MNRHTYPLLALPALICLLATPNQAEEKKPPKISYDDHVKPILRQKCFACHNPDKKNADLDLTNYTTLMQGGGSGGVIEIGDAESSYLYLLVTHDSEPYMPPESPKIADEMIETFRKWIDGGALENAGSTSTMKAKPKFDLALETAPTDRPEVAPMPERLSLEPVIRTAKTTAITALATSPWAPLVAVAAEEQVLLYHTQTLQLLGVLPFPEGIPEVLKFSRNGSLLLAGGGQGGSSGRAVVWNVMTGQRIFEIGDELDSVLAADISADQTLIALGGPQRVVRIYSTATGRKIHELRKHTDWIYSLEFSPDSVLLATGDRNGGLHVWEAWTGREYLALAGHSAAVTALSWRADSNVLASCGGDGNVRLWEMENGKQVKNWGAHGGGVSSLEYARDGRLVTCGRDRVAKLWAADGKPLRAFEAFGDLALEASFCDESGRVIAGDWTGAVRVWNAEDGKRLGELTPNPPRLAERLQVASAQLAANQAAHQQKAATLAAAKATVGKLEGELAVLQSTTGEASKKTAQAKIAERQPPLKAAKERAAAEQKATDAAAAAVVAARQEVDRWTQEADFAKQQSQTEEK
ncbi:MAG: c-type cytochrome domain-containing protein [Pirellulaceae bacterium]